MEEKALTVRPDYQMDLADTMTLGKVLAESGFFDDARGAAQAVVKVLAGREMGFGPIASMKGIYIYKGQVSVKADLMAAAVQRSGRYSYKVRELTESVADIEFFDGAETLGHSRFTAADAQKAGTQNMAKFPRNMLFARAISNGVRWYCPQVTAGAVYTPEELGATIDGETGEIIGPKWTDPVVKAGEEPPAKPEPPAPAPKPAPEKPVKQATVKARQWPKAAAELARAVPYYAKDGQPDFYHMLGAAAKLGYSEVADANLDVVLDALSQYARDKQEPQPLVDADGNMLPPL